MYGAAMGLWGANPIQAFYAAIKVPLLLLVSTAICLPSIYALNAVLGLRDDFGGVVRGILASQATIGVALASLSPIIWTAYASTPSYDMAKLANGAMFAVASIAGQTMLAAHYRVLILKDRRHWFGLAAWLSLYVFVAVQMAWVLRPYIGAPGLPTVFFRSSAWSNAYVEVAWTVWRALSGR